MTLRKAFILTALVALTACSPSKKDAKSQSEVLSPSSLYELPIMVDHEKAAKLNIELGLGYLKQEQISRAKSKFNRAKRLAPNLSEVYYSFGYFHEHVGEIKEAEKDYQKAISLNAKGGIEHHNYGAFLCRQKQYKQAEKEFLRAIEDPTYTHTAQALENAGLCVLQIPDFPLATEYFERALRYDPSCVDALIELSFIKYQERKISEANEYYSRFMKIAKPTARSLMLGIELAKTMEDKDKQASLEMLLKHQFPNAKPGDFSELHRA